MTPPIVKNGVYRYIFNHLNHIDRDRFEFSFLMQNPKELMKTEEYEKYGFEIRSFSVPQRVDPVRFRREIEEILSDKYDVLHLHTSYWRGFMIEEIAMELGVPKVIVHSHSSSIDQADASEREEQRMAHEELKRQFNEKYATDFWACSHVAADWLYGPQIDRRSIKIMPNAIETDRYTFCEREREHYRIRHGLDGKLVIGHTGRFEYQKNHGFLIDVFAKVHAEMPQSVLVLIGEGPGEAHAREEVRARGLADAVIFLGWRDDVAGWLQAFDIYCLPSRFEGLPISLVEAQATGLRCIVSDSVTKEAQITERVDFLGLDVQQWCERIKERAGAYERRDESERITHAGYDIKLQVKLLEKEYAV